MKTESVTPTMNGQDCYIECGCRINSHLGGMPHQLAPHALSMDAESMSITLNPVIFMAVPTLNTHWLSFSPPPPRTI